MADAEFAISETFVKTFADVIQFVKHTIAFYFSL
jgi:hypothetical protein